MKTVFLLTLLATLALTAQTRAAEFDLGTPTSHTPYDRYLGPMYIVFDRLEGRTDLTTVERLVRQVRSFRYRYNREQPYVPQPPEVTDSVKAGDCKAKALWLASKMGSTRVRFVIGKAKRNDAMSHAWLIWQSPSGWLILDGTLLSRPLAPQNLSRAQYLSTYSYAKTGKYLHGTQALDGASRDGDH